MVNFLYVFYGSVSWNEDQERGSSSWFHFVADKAYEGQSITVKAATAEGLARTWWYSVVVPPTEPFCSWEWPYEYFQRRRKHGWLWGIMVLSSGASSVMVNVTGTKGYFQVVLELLLLWTSVTMASGEVTILYETGQAMISHPEDVSWPA